MISLRALLILVTWTHAAVARIEDPSLFVIERDGCSSYLLGTAHVPVRVNEYPFDLEALIKNSRGLWVERTRDPRGVAGVWADVLNDYPPSYSRKLNADQIDQFIQLGVPDTVANILTEDDNAIVDIIGQNLGDREIIDRVIERLAESHGTPVRALDERQSWRAILERDRRAMPRLLINFQPSMTADKIKLKLLKERARARRQYRRGVRRLSSLGEFNLARHQRWMSLLHSELPAGGLFIAVGDRHLYGPGSFVEFLIDAKYNVRKVR